MKRADYAKLIDGGIVFATNPVRFGELLIGNPQAEIYAALGFRPVLYTVPPEAGPGWIAVPGWTETEDRIEQTWTLEPEGEISNAEALDILLGNG